MNRRRLLLSFCCTSLFIYLSVIVGIKWTSPVTDTIRVAEFVNHSSLVISNIDEFLGSKMFENMPFRQRNDLILDYLYREAEKTHNCVMEGEDTRKCFSFKKDVIYAKEIYKEEDMIMKYPHKYNLIINNPNACSNDTRIIIGSPVGPRQYLERMATRLTWGSIRNVNGTHVRNLFFAGQDENDPVSDRLLREENDYYHDIIQFDMKNHFMNLTLLSILTYNWTDYHCPNIDYYIRADNDMWFNPYEYITSFLSTKRTNAIIGNKIVGGKPIRVSVSRYYLPKSVFSDEQFTPYMSGCFLTLTRDILPVIVKMSEKIGPIIYFDDVFLGQIAKKAGITLVSFPYYKVQYYPKAYSGNEYSKIWAIHRYSPVDNLALWQLANL